jgi:Flp pilus assembly protein TadG
VRDYWHASRFTRLNVADESGAVLVEFTVLTPVFFFIIFGIIQFGSLLSLQNIMVNAAREAARTVAVQSQTAAQAQTIASNYLTGYPQVFTYTVTDGCATTPKGQWADVTVNISTPAAAASLINYNNLFTSTQKLSATVVMRKELAC